MGWTINYNLTIFFHNFLGTRERQNASPQKLICSELTSNDHHVNHFPPELGLVVIELPLERQDVVGRADVVFGTLQDLSFSALADESTNQHRGRPSTRDTRSMNMGV